MDIKELKAKVYDLSAQANLIQEEIRKTNEEIMRLLQEEIKDKKK